MENNYVDWKTFKIIITIAIAIFSVLLTIQISLMASMSEVKSNISAIRTDIVWIRESLRSGSLAKK
ncbi:MAG: hypothetical protein ACTSPI_11100 [Candidatus Heimdallarchaeaceae archaeon]